MALQQKQSKWTGYGTSLLPNSLWMSNEVSLCFRGILADSSERSNLMMFLRYLFGSWTCILLAISTILWLHLQTGSRCLFASAVVKPVILTVSDQSGPRRFSVTSLICYEAPCSIPSFGTYKHGLYGISNACLRDDFSAL